MDKVSVSTRHRMKQNTFNQSNEVVLHMLDAGNDVDSSEVDNKITKIPVKAFFCNPRIEEIIIPSGIVEIDDYAFYGCSKLKSIRFSEYSHLFRIGKHAFSRCNSLESITIPDSVTVIDISAFKSCKALKTIHLSQNSKVAEIGAYAFEDCSLLKSFQIPHQVTIINESTFYNCNSLIKITVPFSVKTIKKFAFFTKGSLQQLIIEGNDVQIDDLAFYGVPKSVIKNINATVQDQQSEK